MNFLKKNHFVVNALLFSIAFFVGATGCFVIANLQEGEPFSLSPGRVPYLFLSVASAFFFILLVVLERERRHDIKYYLIFYASWFVMMFFTFVILNTYIDIDEMPAYKREGVTFQIQLKKNFYDFMVLVPMFLLFGTPHNWMLLMLSFLLLYIYDKNP